MLLGCCVLPIYPCLIICDIFERNAGFLSSQSRKFWHVLTQLSFCSSIGRQDKNLAATQCISKLSLKMLRTDPNEIPNMLATSQIVVLLFLGTIPSFYPLFFFCVFLVQVCPEHLASSAEIMSLLNIEGHSKTSFLPIVSSPKLQSKILRVPVLLFPNLKQNLMHACCFTKVAIFQVYQNHKWNHTHTVT